MPIRLPRPLVVALCLSLLALQAPLDGAGRLAPGSGPDDRAGMSAPPPLAFEGVRRGPGLAPSAPGPRAALPGTVLGPGVRLGPIGAAPGVTVATARGGAALLLWGRLQLEGG